MVATTDYDYGYWIGEGSARFRLAALECWAGARTAGAGGEVGQGGGGD